MKWLDALITKAVKQLFSGTNKAPESDSLPLKPISELQANPPDLGPILFPKK